MIEARIRTLTILGLLAVGAGAVAGQTPAPRPLDHDAYDRWNRIVGEGLSPDGRWVAYQLVPGDGDPAVLVRRASGGSPMRIERGQAPVFTDDSRFLVLTLRPEQDAIEEARETRRSGGPRGSRGSRNGGDDAPPDSLAVVDLQTAFATASPDPSALRRLGPIQSFRVPEEDAALVAYLLETPEADEEEEAEAEEAEEPEPEEEPEERSPREERRADKEDGAVLVLRSLDGGAETRFEHVTAYRFSENGGRLYYAASSKDGTADGVYRVETGNGTVEPLITGEGRYLQLAVSDGTGQVAFLTDRDDQEAEQPALALWGAGPEDASATELVAADAAGIPEGWWIGEEGEVRFSDAGSRIFLGTAERPDPPEDEDDEEEPGDEDDGPDPEEVEVDVWNWKDDYLQPMQLIQAERDADRTWLATVPAGGGSVVQLETEDLPDVTVADDGDGAVAIGETDLPYRQLLSWDGRYSDVWLVDVDTGERERVVEKVRGFGGGSLSPGGRWIYWWDGEHREWWVMDTDTRTSRMATGAIPTALHDELDDHPQEPPPYGSAGWTEDGRFLVYDANDVWVVDPNPGGDPPRSLTEGVGRQEGLRFRYVRMDPDEDFVPVGEDLLLSAFHLTTKDDGFYRDRLRGTARPERLVMGPFALGRPDRAEDADRLLLTRETFADFPDLYVTGPEFDRLEKVSDANPQQSEYRWGTADLVEWTSNDGIPLQGILYRPDGFDPTTQYPMMVYFYERMSDRLHRHIVPSAGSSSINISFYVSRGYLVFVPDIPYEIGFPGESAVDAVVPGVLALIDEGFVDPEHIGVQGHSWGGYQIAHMVTRSNIFAAAEAGAPVANMTSAYGGIRWGSGMSRMFQYERTQSRIGGTLWDAQQRYIENSPLFFADKVETPLLMMHNDEDGAVPWYQGIEMFVALRRLGKPAWMLNYNGEDHGLRQEENRKDWAIRMQQFFDHFLKDAPPPVWLAEGVPAELKGETLGLDLLPGEEAMTRPVTQESGGGR
ncbi:MAG: prolyl oligopeptidase family serine peptidase [Gemmatimonadota bacterium]|jgi:dipeptidyl aminopeptidase/acylaminoacyl peptidase